MLQITDHDGLREIRMDRPPANALNLEMVSRLHDAIIEAGNDGVPGLVLSGGEGMFSGGLDVPELLGEPRPVIADFWQRFFALTHALADAAMPVAAAITGHAPAGGAVLALHCDYRIGALGSWKIGLNEVQVGLAVPSTILQALADQVGLRLARRLTTAGRMVEMDEALEIGLVDELVAAETVVDRALDWCRALTHLPPIAMNETRRLGKADFLARLAAADDAATATAFWFSAETQAAMHALVERLSGKN
jgi:3,2-trans-enoyl-CoA isomerase